MIIIRSILRFIFFWFHLFHLLIIILRTQREMSKIWSFFWSIFSSISSTPVCRDVITIIIIIIIIIEKRKCFLLSFKWWFNCFQMLYRSVLLVIFVKFGDHFFWHLFRYILLIKITLHYGFDWLIRKFDHYKGLLFFYCHGISAYSGFICSTRLFFYQSPEDRERVDVKTVSKRCKVKDFC